MTEHVHTITIANPEAEGEVRVSPSRGEKLANAASRVGRCAKTVGNGVLDLSLRGVANSVLGKHREVLIWTSGRQVRKNQRALAKSVARYAERRGITPLEAAAELTMKVAEEMSDETEQADRVVLSST